MRTRSSTLTLAYAAALVAALCAPDTSTAQSGAENGQWRYYGGDAGSTRYAPLDQINPDNVADLEVAWRWRADNFGPQPEFNYRTTPLMVDGVLYATAGYRRTVVAIDAGTGETLWTYRLDEGDRAAPRRNSGRGVAWWEAPGIAPRIFMVTPGFQLVALDAATGRPVPDFGDGGVVELRLHLGRELDLIDAPIGSSSPPIIVDDVICRGVGAAFR